MFLRTHRVGKSVYTEALESYRAPVTGKPRHRVLARWQAAQSFAAALAEARVNVELAVYHVAYYQGVIDRTVRPRFPRHYERAPKSVRRWQAKLDWTTAYVNRLKAVHAKLPSPPSEAEIEAATETVRLRYEQLWGRFARIRGEDT